MTTKQVLISGAGIAGPALAHWLHRYGYSVTVVERAAGPRPGGQAIDIRGAAREVVRQMGILETIRAHHTGTYGIATVDEKGKQVPCMRAEDFGGSGGIIADIEILRNDLVRILVDSAKDAEYLYGDSITGMTEGPDGVLVSFENSPQRLFDIVVGADGAGSGVRALAFGRYAEGDDGGSIAVSASERGADRLRSRAADTALMTDLGFYSGYFTAHTELRLDGWEVMYNVPAANGVGGRMLMLYPIGDQGEVRAMLTFASKPMDINLRDMDAQKRLLARVFSGVGWEVPAMIDQLLDGGELYFSRAGKVEMDDWSRGRAVLLGDAAWAGSVGLGTSMALVGAYVLAGEIAKAGADYPSAFANYRKRMEDYVRGGQQRPPGGINAFLPRTRKGIWLRTATTRMLPKLPGAQRIMGGIAKAAEAIELPDYTASEKVYG